MTAAAALSGRTEPRLWTRPLRPLDESTSLGFGCIEFAETVLELELYPWQRWLLVHALELAPDRSFRFRTIVVIVSRQAGKTTLIKVVALYFLYLLGIALVIGTAQNLDIAEESWNDAVQLAESVPELAAEILHVDRASGRKQLRLKAGPKYKVASANRRGGRGLAAELVVLDELREHQSWEAWGAVTKTTLAQTSAIVVGLSSAGDDASVVLRHLRAAALTAMDTIEAAEELERWSKTVAEEGPDDGDPDDTLALFEWSAPVGTDPRDRAGWALANPSLNLPNGISERALAAAQRVDPPWVFGQECLGIWASHAGSGPFPPGSWAEGTDNTSSITPDSPITVCVEVSWDRLKAHVVVAGRRRDGDLHVEVIATRAGTEWVVPWLLDSHARHQFAAVTVQEKGAPASTLVGDLEKSGLPYRAWSGTELGRAHGVMYDLVRSPVGAEVKQRVWHTRQPLLDVAAGSAVTRPLGDSWVIDRKHSNGDASPIVGAVGAVWQLLNLPAPRKRSVYDSGSRLAVV